jgi:hypothetical protein
LGVDGSIFTTGTKVVTVSVPGGNDHDFHIHAAATAVLAHNCGEGGDPDSCRVSLPSRPAVGGSQPQAFQVEHAGPTECQISGGGQRVWADGLDSGNNATEV